MNKAKLIGIVVVTIVLVVFILFSTSVQTIGAFSFANNPAIKVGLLMPLTGDAASWGQDAKEGAEIAIEEIEKNYPNNNIEFIIEDDKCDPKEGLDAFEKLINIDKVKYTGGTICSSVVLALAKEANEKEIVHLSAGASNPKIVGFGEYVLSLWPLDDADGKAIAEFATKTLNKKNFAILYVNNDYGHGLQEFFLKTIIQNGAKISIIESFASGSKDFRTSLIKIKALNPDALYIATNPSEMPLILKQIKELNITSQIFANGAAMESKDVLEDKTGNTENIFYSMPKRVINQDYLDKFKQKFGKESGFVSNAGYDTVMILFKAIQKCENDSQCVKEYLKNLDEYNGAAQTLSFENGMVVVPFEIKTIVGGQIKVVE